MSASDAAAAARAWFDTLPQEQRMQLIRELDREAGDRTDAQPASHVTTKAAEQPAGHAGETPRQRAERMWRESCQKSRPFTTMGVEQVELLVVGMLTAAFEADARRAARIRELEADVRLLKATLKSFTE